MDFEDYQQQVIDVLNKFISFCIEYYLVIIQFFIKGAKRSVRNKDQFEIFVDGIYQLEERLDFLSEDNQITLSHICADIERTVCFFEDHLIPQWNGGWGAFYSEILPKYQEFVVFLENHKQDVIDTLLTDAKNFYIFLMLQITKREYKRNLANVCLCTIIIFNSRFCFNDQIFFSRRKKLIILTFIMIIGGSALFMLGFILLVGIDAQVSGGGSHQRDLGNPFPFLLFGLILLVISISCALVGLFKK